jgi:tetratricopeptide (TPR) repeat protein
MSDSAQSLPSTLLKRLEAGKVIPFVGAGVSMAVRSTAGERVFPSWTELLDKAADRLERENKGKVANLVRSLISLNEPGDLLDAAKRTREALGSGWYEFLKEQLDIARSEIDEDSLALARAVWGINHLVITTNYDRILAWVAPEGNPTIWNIEAKAEMAIAHRDGIRRPTVWHLHGQIDDVANIILTPDGYDAMYGGSGSESRYVAALATLRDFLSSYTFLFVGFSLEDERFGQQLRYLNQVFSGGNGPHYIILPEREKSRAEALAFPVEIISVVDHGAPLEDLLMQLRNPSVAVVSDPGNAQTSSSAIVSLPSGTPAYNPANPTVSIPFRPKGDQVIGRTEALQRVRDQLTSGKQTSIGQTAAFQGIGGLGKTQLAVEYAWKFKDEYPNGVIWINADQDIAAQLVELSVKARWVAPESEIQLTIEIATHRLQSYSNCLIVFDNVDTIDRVRAFLPEPSANPHLLITSRTEQPGFVPVEIDTLKESEAVDLLLQEANRSALAEDELQAARDIAATLGGLPLALELAGAYLRHRPIPLRSYRDLLSANLKAALPPKFLSSHTRHEADLYATLRIGEDVLSEAPLLGGILNLFAWSGTAPIGDTLLRQIVGAKTNLELVDALSLAEALRFIKRDTQDAGYSMHRLLREVRREDAPIAEHRDWVRRVCVATADWFIARRPNSGEFREFLREIDHLRAWREIAVALDLDVGARLQWLEAYPHFHNGDYRDAIAVVQRAEEMFRRSGGTDTELYAHLQADLGTLHGRSGNHKKSIDLLTKALKTRLDIDGEESEEAAQVYGHLADAYRDTGRYQIGLKYAQKRRSILSSLLGEDGIGTAIAEANIATMQHSLGQYSAAVHTAMKAVEKLQAKVGNIDLRTAYALGALGICEADIGDFNSALKHFDMALDAKKDLIGDQHPDHAVTLLNIGLTLVRAGQAEDAVTHLETALSVLRSRVGHGNPWTKEAVLALASVYDVLGRKPDAVRLIDDQLRRLPQQHASVEELKRERRSLLNVGRKNNTGAAPFRKRRR